MSDRSLLSLTSSVNDWVGWRSLRFLLALIFSDDDIDKCYNSHLRVNNPSLFKSMQSESPGLHRVRKQVSDKSGSRNQVILRCSLSTQIPGLFWEGCLTQPSATPFVQVLCIWDSEGVQSNSFQLQKLPAFVKNLLGNFCPFESSVPSASSILLYTFYTQFLRAKSSTIQSNPNVAIY